MHLKPTAKPSESPQERRTSLPTPAEPVPVIPEKEGENGYARVVFHLKDLPASNAATTLQKLFKAEGESVSRSVKDKVVIVPATISNCLILAVLPPRSMKSAAY